MPKNDTPASPKKSRGRTPYSDELKDALYDALSKKREDETSILSIALEASNDDLCRWFGGTRLQKVQAEQAAKHIHDWLRKELFTIKKSLGIPSDKPKDNGVQKFGSEQQSVGKQKDLLPTLQMLYIYCKLYDVTPNQVLLIDEPKFLELVTEDFLIKLAEAVKKAYEEETLDVKSLELRIPVFFSADSLRLGVVHIGSIEKPLYIFSKILQPARGVQEPGERYMFGMEFQWTTFLIQEGDTRPQRPLELTKDLHPVDLTKKDMETNLRKAYQRLRDEICVPQEPVTEVRCFYDFLSKIGFEPTVKDRKENILVMTRPEQQARLAQKRNGLDTQMQGARAKTPASLPAKKRPGSSER